MKNEIINLNNNIKIEIACNDFQHDLVDSEYLLSFKPIEGWRLPTINELKEIYNHLQLISKLDFKKNWYWSSNSYDVDWNYSVNQAFNFSNGQSNIEEFHCGRRIYQPKLGYLRLVRDFKN